MNSRPAVYPHTRHLTATAAVFDTTARKVLLVFHHGYQTWQLPGGHVDPDETPAEAAVRAVREETGVQATLCTNDRLKVPGGVWHPPPLMVVEFPHPGSAEWAEPPHSHIDELFVATADSTAPTKAQQDEVAGVMWLPVDDLSRPDVRGDVPVVVPYAWRILTGRAAAGADPGS
jgi:8-oxo-dGTP pyrophosphatase MutT (NUDIX family)